VSGDAGTVVEAIAKDSAVAISDNLADRFGLVTGSDIILATASGNVPMRISGIVTADFSGDQGSVILHRNRLEAFWADTQVSHFNLFVDPGSELETVRANVVRALRDRYVAKVLTIPQTLAYHQQMVDRAFAFTYAIQLLVIVVTLAGITDLLTTQVIERRREMGILRVLGASEQSIARAIWVEALVVGLSGAILGAMISVGTSILWVWINFRILIGYILQHNFAFLTATWCFALTGVVAFLAGRLAASSALREPVLEALRHD
jgi:putative ABC transport system permease protein